MTWRGLPLERIDVRDDHDTGPAGNTSLYRWFTFLVDACSPLSAMHRVEEAERKAQGRDAMAAEEKTIVSLATATAQEVIAELGMQPHPEGGHFVETFRDQPSTGERGAVTAIYFLLRSGEVSRWHRVDAV